MLLLSWATIRLGVESSSGGGGVAEASLCIAHLALHSIARGKLVM